MINAKRLKQISQAQVQTQAPSNSPKQEFDAKVLNKSSKQKHETQVLNTWLQRKIRFNEKCGH